MPQNEDTVLDHVQPSTSATPPRALTPVQSDRDHIILRALEELKVQVRQNTLLLQALTSRQPVQNTSQLSEEYKFPMTCDEDLTRVEELLDKPQKKALGRKKAFSAFKITAVIRGASAVQKITASECEAVIKNWLKYSGDRSGGRKRRTGRQQGGDDTVSRDSSSSSSMDDDDF
ncbi:hypothetical protein AALO_G00195960 [Alosa alosa]|uniref:Uncharacterized protein n=1 Tax=Alosa alosa TaxID=278164 RepID=A0AAV6GB64_9TELE|nr:hypothetical protein AALO_G00195960 [Alosa alosa]